jgi:hypothetical protein
MHRIKASTAQGRVVVALAMAVAWFVVSVPIFLLTGESLRGSLGAFAFGAPLFGLGWFLVATWTAKRGSLHV